MRIYSRALAFDPISKWLAALRQARTVVGRRTAPALSHRRSDSVLAHGYATGGQFAVCVLGRAEHDRGAQLEVGTLGRGECDNWRVWRHNDLVAAVLEGQAQLAPGCRLDGPGDRAVGHHAARLEVPRVVALAGAAH